MPENPDFGTFGRYRELLVEEMSPSRKRAYEYTMKERGQVPGPYKIWLQNPKLIEVMVPLGAYHQGHSSLSKAEIDIATSLTNAKWLASYSKLPRKGFDITVGSTLALMSRGASYPRLTSPGSVRARRPGQAERRGQTAWRTERGDQLPPARLRTLTYSSRAPPPAEH